MTSEPTPAEKGVNPVPGPDLRMAYGPIGTKLHMAPGKGWPEPVRGRLECGSAGRPGRLEKVLFEVSDAFEAAYELEFGDDRRAWTWFQLAEHGIQHHQLCLKCFPVAFRRAYTGWLKKVKAAGLPAHLEQMVELPPGTPMTADHCPISACRRVATHVLFFHDAEHGQWDKQLICFPHGATWELGEGMWSIELRTAALLPRKVDTR